VQKTRGFQGVQLNIGNAQRPQGFVTIHKLGRFDAFSSYLGDLEVQEKAIINVVT
jgi:hypothetical protein